MMRKFLLLIIFSICQAHVLNIPVDNINYTFKKDNNFDRILLLNGIIIGEPGFPELPSFVYTFLLPQNQKIKRVIISDADWKEITQEFDIYPVQKPAIIGEAITFTPPDSIIYNSANFYPDNIIQGFHSGNIRGYRIGQVLISPFRYLPVSKRLEVLKKLELKIETEYSVSGIKPLRQTGLSQKAFNRFIHSIADWSFGAVEPPCMIEENIYDEVPEELPSLLGPPVDLLIITTEFLFDAYNQFARLKKLLGFNTQIKTLTWIRQNYSGVDDAERMRNFIKDAVERWGVSFVLLGNDVPKIPTRYSWMDYIMGPFSTSIATDLYFSDLDGNWNFDGDDRFGETSDSIDFYPDVFTGRIPAHSPDEVLGYLGKLSAYLSDPQIPPSGEPPYQRKVLFVSSRFYYENDSYYMAQQLSTHLPNHLLKNFLNERTLQEFKDAIYDKYNLITFLAHGDVNVMRVKTTPRQYVNNFNFDSLTNTFHPLMVVITCYTGPFQGDCLGEHWMINPTGGGLGYIGPTSSSVAIYHKEYVAYLFDSLFSFPLGTALARAKIPMIPHSQTGDNWHRIYQYSLNLLGDPTLKLWSDGPGLITAVSVNPETLKIGIDTVIITTSPMIDSFMVIFYKENEFFGRDTGYSGFCQSIIKTESAGFLKFTILSSSHVPYIDSIYVIPHSSHLVYHHYLVIDTSGNGNGVINPGEEIYLRVGLKNNGANPAIGVFLKLSVEDTFLTVVNDTSSYPDILPNTVAENLTPFFFHIKNRIPDEHPLNFRIKIEYSNTTNQDTFQIIASAPKLSLFTQRYIENGNFYKILPYVENCGHLSADSVVARISAYSDTITILDSTAFFPIIPPSSTRPANDSLMLFLHQSGGVVYNFRLYYRGIKLEEKKITLSIPPKVGSLYSSGMPRTIALTWTPVSGSAGYRIYRAINRNGPYQFLNNPLRPFTYFEDPNVQTGIDYYYYLYAVDASMNEGISSDTILGRSNPFIAQGWPRTVYGYLFSSPNFGDLDPSYPNYEVVVCSKNGDVHLWHYDGTPSGNDPDGIIFHCSGEIFSSPAVGDVDNDGRLEIVFGVRCGNNNLYVLGRYDTIWLPLPNWPKSLPGGVIGSPALADIDDDGDLEIFVISEEGRLYAFQHNGAGLYSPDGLLKTLYGWHSGSVAIGDINGDGNLEIVACGGSESESLFVWDRYGAYLEPFPIALMPKMSFSPSLGNIIGDSKLEICLYSDSTNFVHLVDAFGQILWQNYIPNLGDVEASPVFADITGNQRPEIICGSNQGMQTLSVFDSLGNMISGFPPCFGRDYKLPIVCDADGDSSMDIICGTADWNLYAIKNNGQLVSGFPIHFGIRIEQSPAVFDIDLDGKLELMVGANDYKFWVFKLKSSLYDWCKFRYDPYNSGCYRSPFWFGIKHQIVRNRNPDFSFIVYPNPFKNHLVIKSEIPIRHDAWQTKSETSLKIYDATGRLVKDFSRLALNSESSTILWDGCDDLGRKLPAGVYFVRLEGKIFKQVEKVILLR